MSFNYEIVKHITNQDFSMSAKTLLRDCEAIEQKYNSNDLEGCCIAARILNEAVLRYMYERLVGYRKKAPMAGTILKDPVFKSKITSKIGSSGLRFRMAAEEVQRIGSQYAHREPYSNESDEEFKARMEEAADRLPINAKSILENLTVALEGEISFINEHIPGVRGNLKIEQKTRLSSKTGEEESVLLAVLTDVIDRRDYTYIWKIQGKSTPYREQCSFICLDQPWMIGETIILEANHKTTGQTLPAKYGPIKKEEIISKTKKPGGKSHPVSPGLESKGDNVALGGHLYVKKADNYNEAGVKLQAVLTDADYKLEDDDVSVVWGFIGDNGNFIRITGGTARKSTSFICFLNKGSLGKRYRCIVSRIGSKKTLEADYRKLTADDFAIMGIVEITASPNESVLEAVVRNTNFSGQPVYEWLRDGVAIEGEPTRTIQITDSDIGSAYICRITLPDRLIGSRESEKYVVQHEDIHKSNKEELKLIVGEYEGKKVIWAKFGKNVPAKEDYNWSWFLKKKDGTEIAVYYKGVHLELEDLNVGDEVFCTATRIDNLTDSTSSIVLKEEDFLTFESEQVSDPVLIENAPAAPEPQSRPSFVSEAYFLEKPSVVTAPKFHCFDSNVSRLHYFVSPRNDCYATNSLEYLDYYAFLNELLHDQGYKRVIFVSHKSENKGENFPVITYDRTSEITFLHQEEFNKIFRGQYNISQEDIKAFCDQFAPKEHNDRPNADSIRAGAGGKKKSGSKKAAVSPLCGRRVIKTIVPVSNSDGENRVVSFQYFLEHFVDQALEQTAIKTAILFPIELIQKKDFLNSLVSVNLGHILEEVGDNILIITAPQRTMLSRLFEIPEYVNVEKEIYNVLSNLQESDDRLSHSNAIVDALSVAEVDGKETKRVRILIASNKPGKDEIANLLFSKLLHETQSYKDLPYSKVYSIADYLYANCDSDENTQAAFPELKSNNTWDVTSLAKLDSVLRNMDIRSAIINKANTLHDRSVKIVDRWKPTCLERIYTKIDAVPVKKDRKISYSGAEIIDRDTITLTERIEMRENAIRNLNKLIGLEPVKSQLNRLLSAAANPLAFSKNQGPGHYVFSGNPGTGKTTVARLVGDILHSEGLLKKGHVVEVKKADLVAEHIGGTQAKSQAKFEEALDGVLFFDEAYELVNTDDNSSGVFKSSFDEEAYTLLLKFMEDNRHRVCVICAGYRNKMEKFMDANPGMRDRFSATVDFPDYSSEELYAILNKNLEEMTRLHASQDYLEESKKITDNMARDARSGLEQFGNARSVRKYVEESILNASARDSRASELLADDIPEKYKPIDVNSNKMKTLQTEAWSKLDSLVGLSSIKEKLKKVIEYSVRAAGRNRTPGHYAFVGNPGTGKTEVARLMADILHSNGLLRTNHYAEVKAGEIIGKYVGQSAPLAQAKCEEALDGVLFIDEAYSMVNSGDSIGDAFSSTFAKESYETILKFMEDYRQRICVIFAGYKAQMNVFLHANPGMISRVSEGNIIEFNDFSDDELIEILELMSKKDEDYHIVLTDEFKAATRSILPIMRNKEDFGNARDIRVYLGECAHEAVNRIPRDKRVVLSDGVEEIRIIARDIPERFSCNDSVVINDNSDLETHGDPLAAPLRSFYLSRDMLSNLPNPFIGKDIQDFMNHCKRSTMRIAAKNDRGTAFVITPDGYAVTCAHVVMGQQFDHLIRHGTAVYVTYGEEASSNTKIQFEVVAVKEEFDLALIKLDADFDLPYLKVAAFGTVVSDTAFGHLYGFPDGNPGIKYSEWTPASGEEQKPTGVHDIIRYLSVKAFPGDSGGPVVSDETGEVIGVLQGAQPYRNGDTLNLMKPITGSDFWLQFTK